MTVRHGESLSLLVLCDIAVVCEYADNQCHFTRNKQLELQDIG